MDKEQHLSELISHIEFSLKKAGFPNQKVALPLESIQRACLKRDLVISDVIEVLTLDSIMGTIEGSKIIFRPLNEASTHGTGATQAQAPWDSAPLSDVQSSFQKKPLDHSETTSPPNAPWHLLERLKPLQEIFKDLDPNDFAELQNMNKFKMFFKIRELSKKIGPEKLAKLQEVFTSLSESERSQLMGLLKGFKPG